MVQRLAGVRLVETDREAEFVTAASRAAFVDPGAIAIRPGDRVEVDLHGDVYRAVVFIAPDQVRLSNVASVGRIMRRLEDTEPDSDIDLADIDLPGRALPVLGERVRIGDGLGTVVRLDVPRHAMTVRLDSGEIVTVPANATPA